jgi:SAM-dependent methyltransferase
MKGFYAGGYGPHQDQALRLDSLPSKMWLAYSRLLGGGFLNLYLLPHLRPGRVLDVGCGSGALLRILRDGGWDAVGVETSPEAVAEASKQNLEVSLGELPDMSFEHATFDAVIMKHSLEHTHDPAAVLREVAQILRPRGIAVIGVPNMASLEARAFGSCWRQIDAPRHLYHFTPVTLNLLLSKSGLVPFSIRHDPSSQSLSWSLNYLSGRRFERVFVNYVTYGLLYPLTSFVSNVLRSGTSIVAYARRPITEMET